jgi:hypothetical protein
LQSSIHPDIPVVAVYNNLETFYPFLSRAQDPQVLDRRRYHGDRGLFWIGKRKLVITTAPVPLVDVMCERWGFCDTRFLSPKDPSYALSSDILNDAALLAGLLEYAGPARTIQLIPYATTTQFLQLAQALRKQHGLTVLLPESPAPDKLWLRDYIDSKAGFRILVSQWLNAQTRCAPPRLPYGIICPNISMATGAAGWFTSRGQQCIVKADRGESGLGQIILGKDANGKTSGLLAGNDFLGSDVILVEEYIPTSNLLSPSMEFVVPPLGLGKPQIAHLANQLFRGPTQFCGAIISKEFQNAPWFPSLRECGLLFADYLQEMGYVGHFDLDTVVDDRGELYLLEINARRTGSTYVHEFGELALGPDYLEHAVLLSNALSSGSIRDAGELFRVLEDMLFTGAPASSGVVISSTSALRFNEFGCIIVASSSEEALRLQQEVEGRIEGLRQNVPQLSIP